MKLPKSKLICVEARTLRIHPYAQRTLVPSNLRRFLKELDLDAIGVLHAVEYAIAGVAGIWVVDGQHRVRTLMESGLGEWKVDVKVHLDIKDDERAHRLFLSLNDRSGVSPFDKFVNEVGAKSPWAVGIVESLKRRGIKVSRGSGDGVVSCVSALCSTYARDGGSGKALGLTVDTIVNAWGRAASGLEGKLIEGLGLVYGTYNGSVDQPALIKKLAKYPGGASGLIGDAKGMRSFRKAPLARCIAERIVETYNTGRRVGRLDPL